IIEPRKVRLHTHRDRSAAAADVLVDNSVALTQELLAQPNPHRGVPGLEHFHLRPAYGNPTSTPPSLHGLCELRPLSTILDRARRNTEPIRYFFVRALQPTQLLQFRQIDLHRLAPLASHFCHLTVLLAGVDFEIRVSRMVTRFSGVIPYGFQYGR